LDSWKEIAAYLGRGVRTVQRWEREEGLPVHRLVHDKRGSVYAQRDELAAWWESRRVTLASQPSEDVRSDVPHAPPRLERITHTSSMTSWPALSSDARLIAYVSDGGQDGTTPQIWIQQIGGAALRLTSGEREYSRLSFSPDDTRIVFTASDQGSQNVYEVAALGGEPRLLQRDTSCGQISPDGRWLACIPRNAIGIRIAARDGIGFRTVAPELVDVACATWAPDSGAVLVHARPGAVLEPDWWIVPVDGGSPTNTGLVRLFQERRMFTIPTGAAWVEDSIVFSAAGPPHGVCLYRQRLTRSTFQPAGPAEQLSVGVESSWLPSAGGGRVAFVSSRADSNLWSVSVDAMTGIAHGPLRRMTRGPFPLGYLSLTSDLRTLAYFSYRLARGEVFLRNLETGSERILGEGPSGDKGYPAISPGGGLLAYGMRMTGGEHAPRPIFIVSLGDRSWKKLGEDCGGRPREWVDERALVLERFARLNSVAVLDTETGEQRELLQSGEQSIRNPRLSPDRRWIAFDASRPGEPASVYVAPFRELPVVESDWVMVDHHASHPFWSADGRFIYYTPIGTNPMVRSAIRGRHFASTAGPEDREPIAVYASNEMTMPAYLAGTAPIATADQIILVLGDFTGDIWLMDL
jgi:Tol biopolymer transport system component